VPEESSSTAAISLRRARSVSLSSLLHPVVHLKIIPPTASPPLVVSRIKSIPVVAAAWEAAGIQTRVKDPLQSRKKMSPASSAVSPAPAPQIAPSLPFGVTLITVFCASVVAFISHHPPRTKVGCRNATPTSDKSCCHLQQPRPFLILRRIEHHIPAGTVIAISRITWRNRTWPFCTVVALKRVASRACSAGS